MSSLLQVCECPKSGVTTQLTGLPFEWFDGPPSSYGYEVASRKFLVGMFASYLGKLKCSRSGFVPSASPPPMQPCVSSQAHTFGALELTRVLPCHVPSLYLLRLSLPTDSSTALNSFNGLRKFLDF